MAKSRKQEELDLSQERSIGTFQTTVDNFSKVAEKLANSFDGFANTQELDRKAKKKVVGEKKVESGNQKKVSNAMNSANDLFGKKTMSVAGKLMGKSNFDGFKKGLAGMKTGKSFGGGMMGKAAGGLGSAGGMILRAAGPVGAVISGLKMAFDFWDSGGLAKLVAGVKMATSAGSMMGPGGIAEMQKNLEGTEEFRKIDAKYAYQKPLELQQQLEQEIFDHSKGIAMDKLNFQQSLVKDEVEYEFGLRKDALQFQLDQAKETLDAELEKRKAIAASGMDFIKNYASISERALKAIGSGTKQILEGVTKFQSVFGLGVKESFQLSENAQGLAYHLGGSDEDVMNMTNMFRLMGNTSAEMAQDLIGGFSQFAKINDIAPQVIFNQIKEAGEDIYKFSSGTADNFAKQAVSLSKMGVSMSSMMKASDSMVLNYKDSIKAEMSLSAMLGKNVNLSEVRAKLMAGDQAGGAKALKSALGGIDINQMNAFQKQALTQATGMDISALLGLQQGKTGEVSGELKAEAAKGKAFADAALNQDLANAGAKLKLEQEQRKKLLEFEQRQRLAMMFLEQAQKLDQIKLESAYRLKFEMEYGADREKALIAANALVESASNPVGSRGAKTMAEQAFASYGFSNNVDTSSSIDTAMKLLKEERITSGEFGQFVLDLNGALANVNVKDDAAVQAAINQVSQSTFGGAISQKNNEIATTNKRQENIARAYAKQYAKGSDGSMNLRKTRKEFESFTETYKVSAEEIEAAMSLIKQERVETSMGNRITRNVVDETKVKAQSESGAGLVFSEQSKYSKLTVDATNKTNESNKVIAAEAVVQTAAQQAAAEVQYRTLSESQYTTKLQEEMVALLGLSTQILANIMNNAAFENDTNYTTLDGKTVGANLLNYARKAYAVSRVARTTY